MGAECVGMGVGGEWPQIISMDTHQPAHLSPGPPAHASALLPTFCALLTVVDKSALHAVTSGPPHTFHHRRHVVCAQVTNEFLQFSRSRGNDLMTPAPWAAFPGLKDGEGSDGRAAWLGGVHSCWAKPNGGCMGFTEVPGRRSCRPPA